MALSRLPKTFGLEELTKGYFPHLFNRPENQEYVGEYPDVSHYSPSTMSSAERERFLKWYEEKRTEIFDFQKEMLVYCRSDVDILRRCCMEFRAQFLNVSGVDPFTYVTIASACMAAYRSSHIQEDILAMVPVNGYVNKTCYSRDGVRWLEYISSKEGIYIRHSLNGFGEQLIEGNPVDGFCVETNTIYQYQGCFYHGCAKCFERNIINPVSGISMNNLLLKSDENVKNLRLLGYTVIEMWEHDFILLKKTEEFIRIMEGHEIVDRLNPRDAFFGGRTNAVKLYFEGQAKYIDFTSLYPWVNKYCEYPIGHPEIITEDFTDIEEYFGVVKCKVIPPRSLFHPVLPYRSHGKLMFPLCRSCTDTLQQSVCTHNDDHRALTGTWVSEELKKAKSMGYKIAKIYEVYHFSKRSADLFKSYIDLFLRLKQESSGWPTECVTEETKKAYIESYAKREGIDLNAECIQVNPGRRSVAKLALNSFWGRWGMSLNKNQLSFVSSLTEFNKILSDSTIKVKDIFLPSPVAAALMWCKEERFVPQDTSTNVFLAAFTTCYARLKLYDELERLGRSVLYFDTDSIIYQTDGQNDPPTGNFLGDFTDELDGRIITSFVSGGPKNYAYNLSDGTSNCKIKGFSLNFKNSLILNYETVKELVCSMDKAAVKTVLNPRKIIVEKKKRKLINKEEARKYQLINDKRVIQSDFSTLPYGF
ncbi:unnamed protein product [Larinioides sclopetarius]|uniref:DNA-directed DNA polymerase n=1 Tax=Larinioides sclopetarius TaxID=280406 RepID=A0AAV2BIU0_9ARAC